MTPPNDPAPLTEAEREFLADSLAGPAVKKPDCAATIDALVERGLMEPRERYTMCYWAITDAGRAALIEAAVAERFATLDRLCEHLALDYADHTAIRELARLARDQERRLVRIEQQRGGGA